MSDDESLSLFGKEEKGGGVEVSGIGEPGRDTVRYLSYAFDCIVEEQRADDASTGGAIEEEEWRAVWREERVEMGVRPEE